jgi:muconolactone delta-isomerase
MQYLVIMRVKPGTSQEQLGPLMKPEAAKAWDMMASGALRSIHFIKGPVGAVLLFEVSDEKEVEVRVSQLPLVEAGLVNVEVLPLTPFTGFAALFSTPPV